MPWDIGCCWAYGDSCTTSCNNVWVDDPPSVSGSVSCATPGSGGWCRGGASLNLTTSDPQGYPTTINGSMGGTPFSCSGSCSQALPQGAGSASFTAVASGGGNLSSTPGSAILPGGQRGSFPGHRHSIAGWVERLVHLRPGDRNGFCHGYRPPESPA